MKIIVNSLDLNDAVAKVSKALPSKDVAPVLECIKITAENDRLTLYATDKDLAIEKLSTQTLSSAENFWFREEFSEIIYATYPITEAIFRWK